MPSSAASSSRSAAVVASGLGGGVAAAARVGPHVTGTYYVATTGSGTACTAASPCATVEQALVAGNSTTGTLTVSVAAGTYAGITVVVPPPASPAPSWSALVVDGHGAASTTIDAAQEGTAVTVALGSVTLSGLTVTGGWRPGARRTAAAPASTVAPVATAAAS